MARTEVGADQLDRGDSATNIVQRAPPRAVESDEVARVAFGHGLLLVREAKVCTDVMLETARTQKIRTSDNTMVEFSRDGKAGACLTAEVADATIHDE